MLRKRIFLILALALLLALATAVAGLAATTAANVTAGAFTGTVPDDGFYSDAGQVTLLVNGVETQIVPGATYSVADNAVIAITDAAGSYANFASRPSEDYRTALFVDANGVFADQSVTAAITQGAYTATDATGLLVNANSDNFSGVMVTAGQYTVTDSVFNFLSNSDGSDASDFTGLGAVLSAFGADTKLIVKNVTIHTAGVARAALVTDEGADSLVEDSTLTADGGTLYAGYQNSANQAVMVAPPWVLGISGTARTTNLLGNNSTNTFVRSTVNAAGWGALSTDDSSAVTLTTIDSTVNVTGEPDEVGGYGTYAIGNAVENFYGTAFNVATFANILTGGTVTYASSNGTFDIVNTLGETVFTGIEGFGKASTVQSKAFGVMFHSQGGTVQVTDGTSIQTQNAAFLVKSASATIQVDHATVTAQDGVLLQVMDSDDSAVGLADSATVTFNTLYSETEGYPGLDFTVSGVTSVADSTLNTGEAAPAGGAPQANAPSGNPPQGDLPSGNPPANSSPSGNPPQGQAAQGNGAQAAAADAASKADVSATFTNTTLKGNLYNATGYTGTAENLAVTLGTGASLTGAISATSAIHSTDQGITQNASFTMDEFWKLGHVWNKPYYNGVNNVTVTLTDGGIWTVSDTSVITALVLGGEWSISGDVYMNGVLIKPMADQTYTGVITVVPAGSVLPATVS